MDIFHFVSISRLVFNDLVGLLTPYILAHSQSRDHPKGRKGTSAKCKFTPRDILVIKISSSSSVAKNKDIHCRFGKIHSCYTSCVELGMATIMTLIDHPDCRVRWDRSIDHYRKVAERTEMFLDI